MKRKNIVFKALTCGLASLAFTACTDTWETHYQPKPELNATETLWDLIQADPELSKFEEIVKATGYDEILSQNRFYTVWAPVDGSDFYNQDIDWATLSDSMINVYKYEFVENHIADYNHTASGVMSDNLVEMLNGKYNRFEGAGNAYTFKGNNVIETNIAAKNGLLHKADNNAVFTANVWEQISKETSISALTGYLKSFDEIFFDRANSVEGPKVNGQTTYLDSVVEETNVWFSRIGFLNREDSSYTMFAPTNKAWDEAYEKAKHFFVFDEQTPNRDSLQEAMTKDFLCRHLVFSNTIQESPADSLTSISYGPSTSTVDRYNKEVFRGADRDRLYENLVKTVELSNGVLNIVDSYNYYNFWHDTLRIQGESLYGEPEGVDPAEYETCTKTYESISKDSVEKYNQTSNGIIGIYTNNTPTGNPTLTYTIKNVLSAKYRVKVVIVPANFVDYRDSTYRPNKFNASIKYRELSGKSSKSISLGKNIENNPYKVDTITLVPDKVAEGVDYIEFPTNEYDLQGSLPMLQLEIAGKVKARGEDDKYDRVLRIEQVFLEPVTEE